jgi:hypothetical protein
MTRAHLAVDRTHRPGRQHRSPGEAEDQWMELYLFLFGCDRAMRPVEKRRTEAN